MPVGARPGVTERRGCSQGAEGLQGADAQLEQYCLGSEKPVAKSLHAVQAAEDYRADAQLEQYCQGDVERVCSDVKPGGGRIQECLVSFASRKAQLPP